MIIEELLNKYDLFHSSIIDDGKVKFNINYLPMGNVYISLVALINEEEKKYTIDTIDDDNFKYFCLPKILECFFSKNPNIHIRKIMGNSNQGTLVIQREDLCDCLIIRNCSTKIMNLAEDMYSSFCQINKEKDDSILIFDANRLYENYIKYNLLFDYAKYRKIIFKDAGEINKDNIFLLNIARYVYSFDDSSDLFNDVKNSFNDNDKVEEACEAFKANDYSDDNIYSKILLLAEFEMNNDVLIRSNGLIIEEADKAIAQGIEYFDDRYLSYWTNKQQELQDEELRKIALGFIEAYGIKEEVSSSLVNPNNHDKLLITTIKNIKNQKIVK